MKAGCIDLFRPCAKPVQSGVVCSNAVVVGATKSREDCGVYTSALNKSVLSIFFYLLDIVIESHKI